MSLTISLLIITVTGIGTLWPIRKLFSAVHYLHCLVGEHLGDVASIKVMLASVRQDLSIDRANVDERFGALTELITEESMKTRKDIQEVKTRVTDDEKDDQRQKAKDRATKKAS